MIFDSISNWSRYLNPAAFQRAFDILDDFDKKIKDGIYFREKDLYFKVVSYQTVAQPKIIESHIREVDIQIVLEGEERIKIYDKNAVKITEPYSAETDCQFYEAEGPEIVELKLSKGKMAIFFPQDIHQCQFFQTKKERIKKVVIKANEELFTY